MSVYIRIGRYLVGGFEAEFFICFNHGNRYSDTDNIPNEK